VEGTTTELDISFYIYFWGGGRPQIYFGGSGRFNFQCNNRKMAMSQSERIRRLQEDAPRYISRAKVRDASEITMMQQAKASKTHVPQTIVTSCETIKGKGANMEYLSILQAAQGAAICADPPAYPGIYLPGVGYDHSLPPFSQQDPANAYIPACKPGFKQYFHFAQTSTCCNETLYPSQ